MNENGATEGRHQAALELDANGPNAVAEFIAFLGDPNWRVRKTALGRLPDFRERPTLVVDLIAGLADDQNAGLRAACAEALQRMGSPVNALVQALHTTNVNQRKVVAEILRDLGTPDAREQLMGALDDPDANARAAVAEALGSIGGEDVIAELRRRLVGAVDDLQQSAYLLDGLQRARARMPWEEIEPWLDQRALVRPVTRLLGLSGDVRAIQPLIVRLSGRSRGAREAALIGLDDLRGRLEPPGYERLRELLAASDPARQRLVGAMGAEDEALGAAAIRVLGVTEDPALAPIILQACASRGFLETGLEVVQRIGPAGVPPMLAALPRVDVDTRVLALEMIELMGDASAVEPCLEIAAGDEPRAAEAAVRVLARLGDERALDVLVDVVTSGDSNLLDQTVLALASIGASHPEATADRILAEIERGKRHWVWFRVLGSIGREADVPLLVEAMSDPMPEIREAAVHGASELGHLIAPRSFMEALVDREPRVRASAARALANFPGQTTYTVLSGSMADSDPWVVAEAVRSLGRAGGQRAVTALESAAHRGKSQIVIAAVQSLVRLNPPTLERTVRALLGHDDPEVVLESLEATVHLSEESALDILGSVLRHPAWLVRRRSAELLGQRGLGLRAATLEELLQTETELLVVRALEDVTSVVGPA